MNISECRVAIADDEVVTRYFLKSIFKSLSMTCVGEAATGEEAVALYAKEKPDLLFLDFNMPIMKGADALKAIRARFPDAHVVMMTSVAEAETVNECIQHGALNYILKSNPLEKIKAMIEDIVKSL